MNDRPVENAAPEAPIAGPPRSQCIDWYAEGQARIVEVGGVQVTVRYVGRKGRRARIAITAPAGAVFCTAEREWPNAARQHVRRV